MFGAHLRHGKWSLLRLRLCRRRRRHSESAIIIIMRREFGARSPINSQLNCFILIHLYKYLLRVTLKAMCLAKRPGEW